MPAVEHLLFDNTFVLSPQRSMYWVEEQTLILSDLHLGKTGHFRKAGIAVPQAVFKEDMQRLFSLVQYYKPRRLIVIGDMFHSHGNLEHDFFLKWRNDFAALPIHLVKGNHDILSLKWYDTAGIEVFKDDYCINGFGFTHDKEEADCSNHRYTFSGHLHPGIALPDGRRQTLYFPCFYFGNSYAVLPAFSRFTGIYTIKPRKGEKAYAIMKEELVGLGY